MVWISNPVQSGCGHCIESVKYTSIDRENLGYFCSGFNASKSDLREWDGSTEMDKTLHCINIHAATHFSRGEMAHFQTNTSPIHYSKPLDLCLCTHTTTANTLPHKHTCIYVCVLSEILEKSKSLCGDDLEWDYRTNVSSANVSRNVNVVLWFKQLDTSTVVMSLR